MGAIVSVIALGFMGCGLALFVSAFIKSKRRMDDPNAIPAAKIATGGVSRLHTHVPGKRHPLNNIARVVGGAMLTGVGYVILEIVSDLSQPHHGESKGRLLRLRGKSTLPARARGDGWHDDAVPRVAHLSLVERRALAEAWLLSARMEHASIAAFSQLSLHLAALGAPADLVELTHLAALDEIRHARRCFAIARGFGGEAWTAGPIVELRGGEPEPAIDLVRLAIGSLVDGCVAEGIAADVVGHAAQGAVDPVVRDTLAMIAEDEAGHAEVAWAVLAWCLVSDGDAVRGPLEARLARLGDELAPPSPPLEGIAPERYAANGLVDQDTIGAIALRRVAAVQARATAMVAQATQRARAA
jgi:hypothetical protein